MKNNLNEELNDLKIKINRARFNLMFMIILTVVNIYTILSNSNLQMPFSCSIASYSVALGKESYAQDENITPLIIGIFLSIIILSAFTVCYFKSKKSIVFLVAPIGIIVVDTFALLVIALFSVSIASSIFLLDFVFHILSVFYLVKGIKAFKQIGDFKEFPIKESTNNESDAKCETQTCSDDELEIYEDDGTIPLLSGDYNGLNIFVVNSDGVAELVVNNYVCDRLSVAYLFEYELCAYVNEISLTFKYNKNESSESMFLYADDELLDSKNILL